MQATSLSPPSTITSVLRCLGTAGTSIPVPGIAPAIAIVISIVELVESIRTAKQNCRSLAEKAAQLVLSLHTEASALNSDCAIYKRIQGNIAPFRRILEDIKEFIGKISRSSRVKWLWKRDAILERILELTNNLDTCYQTFQITSFVHLQTLLAQINDDHTANAQKIHQKLSGFRRATLKASEQGVIQLRSEIRAVEHNITSVWKAEVVKTNGLLEEIAISVQKQSLDSKLQHDWIITSRELEPIRVHISRTKIHGGVTLARYRNKDVIVKRFDVAENFVKELNTWKELWHPYLPRLIAYSSESEKQPFIVLDGKVVPRDIRSFLQSFLEKNTITGLLKGLQTMYGISSAVQYLRTTGILTKSELEKCMQLSNIMLSNHNGIILGENLISCATIKPHVPDCHRDATLEGYLADKFWILCMKILCPNNRFAPLEVNSGQGPCSIFRLLLNFGSFGTRGRTLTQISNRLERAWLRLDELRHGDQFSFADIRKCFLDVDDLPHFRSYSPRIHWGISTGDIGYVRDGTFIRLANVLDDSSAGFRVSDTEFLRAHCDPDEHYTLESISNDWDRYEFKSPSFVSFWHSHRYAIDDALALRYLLQHANLYLDKFGASHSIVVTDLILVTNREITPRHSGVCSYDAGEHPDDEPPQKVYFFEKTNGDLEGCWGYWSLDPEWVELPQGTMSNIIDSRISAGCVAFPQMFEFVQLEKEDEI